MIWAWFVSSTSKNYLNYSEIIELFKIKQGLTEVKIRQLMAGGTRKRLAPHRRNKDNCAENFNNHTIVDYLTALGYGVGK